MKVLTVVGARPQFVKAASVSIALDRAGHEEVLVHTGQHYDEELSAVFFEELSVPEPAYHLGIGSAAHGRQTGWMMAGLEPVVERENPDAVLVYGDTNSTLAGALVASKAFPLLAHVEAGLRSYNRAMPEEVNRVLTDHAADLLLAPTDTAVRNLAGEGITDGVHQTGDVMYDTLLRARDRAGARLDARNDLDVPGAEFVLATVHRPGNVEDPDRLAAILQALIEAPQPVLFPAHPRTVEALRAFDYYEEALAADGLRLIDPVGYLSFVGLLDRADRVVTDSGGVQKEAFFLDTPCVTLREETEWVETVEAGWNVLAGADSDAILGALAEPFPGEETGGGKPQPYGGGDAADRIVEVLENAV